MYYSKSAFILIFQIVVNSKPDSVLLMICPFYRMPLVLLNLDKVAGIHFDTFIFIFKTNNGASYQDKYPFVFLLIIPEVLR